MKVTMAYLLKEYQDEIGHKAWRIAWEFLDAPDCSPNSGAVREWAKEARRGIEDGLEALVKGRYGPCPYKSKVRGVHEGPDKLWAAKEGWDKAQYIWRDALGRVCQMRYTSCPLNLSTH